MFCSQFYVFILLAITTVSFSELVRYGEGCNGSDSIFAAIKTGKEYVVKCLIEYDQLVGYADIVNSKEIDMPYTPLMIAAEYGQSGIVSLLIQAGAHMDDRSTTFREPGWTAIMFGIKNNNVDAVKALVIGGADINIESDFGYTPLGWVAEKGNEFLVILFLENGVNIDKGSPLVLAAGKGHHSIVQILLENKADANYQGESKVTALMAAAKGGHANIAQTLLSHGAYPDVQQSLPINEGWTALHYAIESNNYNTVEVLVSNGANLNLQTGHGYTPLAWAAEIGDIKLSLLLIRSGADVNICTSEGSSPLMLASKNGFYEITKTLLSYGAQIDASDSGNMIAKLITSDDVGMNPLTLAASNNHHLVVQLLIDNRANLNFVSRRGTAVMLATENGHEKVVQLLVRHGADIHMKDPLFGQTPLISAASKGSQSMVKILIDGGANVNAQIQQGFFKGYTALIYAAMSDHYAIVRMLINNGANINLGPPGYFYGTYPPSRYAKGSSKEIILTEEARMKSIERGTTF